MTVSTLTTASWLDDWRNWRAGRLAETTAEHGIASLASTTWLTDQPLSIPGLPGVWWSDDGEARGDTGQESYRLAPGDSLGFAELLLRAIVRRSAIGIRFFDPAAPSRTTLAGIETFVPDERWQISGRFEASAAGATRAIQHVDGARTDDAVAGVVRIDVIGERADLLVFPAPDGQLQVTFADRTNGRSTAQFRFLTLPRPGDDGSVTVDFNRAYLPPCAFSDHYLCPLPPPQNRLPFDVTAGETFILRR